jgi:hypothetical protein
LALMMPARASSMFGMDFGCLRLSWRRSPLVRDRCAL